MTHIEEGKNCLGIVQRLQNFRLYVENPWIARYIYGTLFLFSTLLSWIIRDFGSAEFKRKMGSRMGASGVQRVSLGCFLFYFGMFLSTVGTSKLHQLKDLWHSGMWSLKIVLFIALTLFAFLLPQKLIYFYAEAAHFGAGVFLLIQLISIICFIIWINDVFNSEKYSCRIHVMLFATASYGMCIVGIIFMYIWHAPEASCLPNVFFITLTLVLLVGMTAVSLHPKVNSGFLTPGLMGLYLVFLCWSAIRSEPPDGICNKKATGVNRTDWLTIISFVIALLAMVIAAFSTGIDSECFRFGKGKKRSEEDVPYGYGYFHFVFATAAMYVAMLLDSWSVNHAMRKWTMDVGWTSTCVRIVNQWLAAFLYIWIVWKNKNTTPISQPPYVAA